MFSCKCECIILTLAVIFCAQMLSKQLIWGLLQESVWNRVAGTTNWSGTEKVYFFMKSYKLTYMFVYIHAVHTINYSPVSNVHYPWKRKLILTIVNPLTYLFNSTYLGVYCKQIPGSEILWLFFNFCRSRFAFALH